MLKNRNIALVIVFGLISCGIYWYYWLYVTADALEQQGQAGGVGAAVILILSILLPPVGFIMFGMSAADNLNNINTQRGLPTQDNKTLYIILGLLIAIVLVIMVQLEINKLVPAEG